MRSLAGIAAVGMLWFMSTKIDVDASLIANLNGFKREFALAAALAALAWYGGGSRFIWWQPAERQQRPHGESLTTGTS